MEKNRKFSGKNKKINIFKLEALVLRDEVDFQLGFCADIVADNVFSAGFYEVLGLNHIFFRYSFSARLARKYL